MTPLFSLGYVVLNVTDFSAWEDFATRIIGLMAGRRTENSLALRMDDYAMRILLKQSNEDDIAAAGWQFDSLADLETYTERLKGRGVEVYQGDRELAKGRYVERLHYCVDPNGVRHEFFFGPTHAPISSPFRSPVMKGSGFVTGRQGLGHILPISKDYEAAVSFYTDVLGFNISDYIRDSETIPGLEFDATFFHTPTGRHHSLATAYSPDSMKLNHIMLEAADLDDVGLAYDRCVKEGLRIKMGIGHHPNDKVVSFYVETPSGFDLELGYGSIIIDEKTWEVKNYSQMSDWGHDRTIGRSRG